MMNVKKILPVTAILLMGYAMIRRSGGKSSNNTSYYDFDGDLHSDSDIDSDTDPDTDPDTDSDTTPDIDSSSDLDTSSGTDTKPSPESNPGSGGYMNVDPNEFNTNFDTNVNTLMCAEPVCPRALGSIFNNYLFMVSK